ncbi:MAG: hypothetical protein Q9188_003353 [Gyalolechia gomerana]
MPASGRQHTFSIFVLGMPGHRKTGDDETKYERRSQLYRQRHQNPTSAPTLPSITGQASYGPPPIFFLDKNFSPGRSRTVYKAVAVSTGLFYAAKEFHNFCPQSEIDISRRLSHLCDFELAKEGSNIPTESGIYLYAANSGDYGEQIDTWLSGLVAMGYLFGLPPAPPDDWYHVKKGRKRREEDAVMASVAGKMPKPKPSKRATATPKGRELVSQRKATPEARPSKPRQQKGARNKVLTLLASRGKLLRSTPVNKQIGSTIGTRWVHCTTRTHKGYHRFALPQPNFFARRCFVKARSGSIRPDHCATTSQQAGRSVHELLSSTKRARASQPRRDPRSSDKQEGY